MHEAMLASWADGPARSAITDFVEDVGLGGEHELPVEQRIAVFDNDGTLWIEKPLPTQLHFVVLQWAAAAAANPQLAEIQPYLSAVSGDYAWLGAAMDKHYAGDDSDLSVIIAALLDLTDGMSVEQYEHMVGSFYENEQHMSIARPYSHVVYQPMVELLHYLDANEFTCYIVSGGDRDFMRPMTLANYGIPPERVIGSAVGLGYADGEVRYSSSFSFLDDGDEKPVRIWSRIGRRPVFAAGNSNGDLQMLQYVQGSPHSLSVLIVHDDADRDDPPYVTGAEQALAAADESNFIQVSVRDDWRAIFPDYESTTTEKKKE
jgi:phosphoglycolate phosphatase-like HAD superfamily hydrolase